MTPSQVTALTGLVLIFAALVPAIRSSGLSWSHDGMKKAKVIGSAWVLFTLGVIALIVAIWLGVSA